MSNWTKLQPIKGSTACCTCGCGSHDTLDPESLIAVGFGSASVTKGGQCVYDENEATWKAEKEGKDPMFWQCKDAEAEALKDPDHDWRIHLVAPLYEAEYQRQGDNHWVLVRKGEGFA